MAPRPGWVPTEPLLISYDGWVYRSASGLALAVTIAGSIAMGCFGLAAFLGLSVEYEDEWDTIDAALIWIGLGAITVIPTMGLIIAWTRRVTGNLKPFGADLELGTAWAVGAFFTPILMFWFPVRLWNQAWRATSPNLPPPIGWNYKWMQGRHLHWVANTLWLTVAVGSRVPVDTTEWTAFDVGGYLALLGGGAAVALLLLILLVRGLTARQDTYARIWAGAVPAAWPAPPGG